MSVAKDILSAFIKAGKSMVLGGVSTLAVEMGLLGSVFAGFTAHHIASHIWDQYSISPFLIGALTTIGLGNIVFRTAGLLYRAAPMRDFALIGVGLALVGQTSFLSNLLNAPRASEEKTKTEYRVQAPVQKPLPNVKPLSFIC